MTDYLFRILLLGVVSVGKSSIGRRYCWNKFYPNLLSHEVMRDTVKSNVGVVDTSKYVDFYKKIIKREDDNIVLQIWDVHNEGEIRLGLPFKLKLGFDCSIFIFDVTNPESIDLKVIDYWLYIVRKNDRNMPIFLIGNKTDLDNDRKVTQEEALNIMMNFNLVNYFETSAKEDLNINEAFNSIIEYLLKNQ